MKAPSTYDEVWGRLVRVVVRGTALLFDSVNFGLYGPIFADTFEYGDTGEWSQTVGGATR